MTKRYFYRCPYRACIMREHGIEYTDPPIDYMRNPGDSIRHYIHPDSLQLLQPMVGDVMVGNGILCVEPFMVDYHMLNKPSEVEARLLRGKIILRNNLPFVTPESEGV